MNLPFWPFYVGDYLADTMHLTTAEHGAYLLLLMAYWKKQGPLPDNNSDLAQITRLSLSDWEATRLNVAPFFKIDHLGWHHSRMDRDIEKQQKKYLAQSKAATKTNQKRWQSLSVSLSESLSVSQPEPEPEPEPNKEKPADVFPKHPRDEISAFIVGWRQNFKKRFGYEYPFDNGRNRRDIKAMLETGILRIDLLEMAKRAWNTDDFYCQKAGTIEGMRNNLASIQLRLNGKNQPSLKRPVSDSICVNK